MKIYRQSQTGTEQSVRKGSQKLKWWRLIVLVFSLVAVASQIDFQQQLAVMLFVLVVVFIPLLWGSRKWKSNLADTARSTEIELNEQELIVRNSTVSHTIRREDLVELRILQDGVLVKGRGLLHWIKLPANLDGYEDLLTELQQWAPVTPTQGTFRNPSPFWFSVIPLGLFLGGLIAPPAIAAACCVAVALIFSAITVWTFSNRSVQSPLKKSAWVMILLIIGMIARAHMLLTQP
jgi:hypothetical protein